MNADIFEQNKMLKRKRDEMFLPRVTKRRTARECGEEREEGGKGSDAKLLTRLFHVMGGATPELA